MIDSHSSEGRRRHQLHESTISSMPTGRRRDISRAGVFKRPNVSFSNFVSIGTTIHLNDLSQDEIDSFWVTPDDFEHQRRSADLASELYEFFYRHSRHVNRSTSEGEQEQSDHDDGVCKRGLESRTSSAIAAYSEIYYQSIIAVYEEQERQREMGIVDPERIARVCQLVTYTSRKNAILRGKKDALEAKQD